MRPPRLYLFALLAATASSAFASDYAAIERQCREEMGQLNNSVVMGCAEQASDAARKDMNRVYQKTFLALRKLGEEDAAGFEAAQKAWLQYREAWCDSQSRSIGTPYFSICRMNLNIARVAELEAFYGQVPGQ